MGTEVLQQYEQKSFVSGYGKLGDSTVKTVEAGASLIDQGASGSCGSNSSYTTEELRIRVRKAGRFSSQDSGAGASLIDSDGLLQGQQAVPILRTRLKRWEPK